MNIFNDTIGVFSTSAIWQRKIVDSYSEDGTLIRGGYEATEDIRCSIQPAAGSELRDLPEGIREDISKKIYCNVVLQIGDKISDGNGPYRVVWVKDWVEYRIGMLAEIGAPV